MKTSKNKTAQTESKSSFTQATSFFAAKPSINAPGDFYSEADTVPGNLMHREAQSFSQDSFFKPSISSIQRKCGEFEGGGKLHRKKTAGTDIEAGNDVDGYISSVSSSGGRLPETTRQFFEPRFGHDFSGVRIHHDSRAAKSAQSVNALAYTAGNNIVFNLNQFSPESNSGKKLLAHELTHVIQQHDTGFKAQRQEGPESSPVNVALNTSSDTTIQFGAVLITTHRQLLLVSRIAVKELMNDLIGSGEFGEIRERANEWILWVQSWQPYLEKLENQPLTPDVAEKARTYLSDWGAIRRSINAASTRRELRRIRVQAEAGASRAEQILPIFADQLRAAYRKGKESHIKEWAEKIGTVTALGIDMHELSQQITEAISEVENIASESKRLRILDPVSTQPGVLFIELGPLSKLTEALEFFNKALAVINIAFIITDSEKKATELEEGINEINHATELFAELATLSNFAPHIGLYLHIYLVPMTKTIRELISHLMEQLHDVNKEWIEFSGEFIYGGAEPGDQEMLRFMKEVMHAESPEEVPYPNAPSVKKYFLEHREAIEAGIKEEIPTKGWWRWLSLDSKKVKEWLFNNRRLLWAMLYGSTPVPQ